MYDSKHDGTERKIEGAETKRFADRSVNMDSEGDKSAEDLRLLVVVVCYRSVDLTLDCLRALADQIGDVPGTHVTVCENGTGETAVLQLRDAAKRYGWEKWLTVMAISPNRGFAGGNNAVLQDALENGSSYEYFLLLNSDTVVRPGAIAELIAAADQFPTAGIIGSRLEWPDEVPQGSAFLDFTALHEFVAAASSGPVTKLFKRGHGGIPVRDEVHEADWVSFACALIRREVLADCGLLDDGYFLYFDDADYCRRARIQGWKVLYYPLSRVVHLRGRSNPVKSLTAKRQRRPQYWYVSRNRYYAKFYGRGYLWLANMLWLCGRLVSYGREMIGKKERSVCELEWRDIWINSWTPLRIPHSTKFQQAPHLIESDGNAD